MRAVTATLIATVLAATPARAQGALPVMAGRLVPHRDSMVIVVNGQARGTSILELARSGDSLRVLEATTIPGMLEQSTTVALARDGQVLRVSQTGTMRGANASIEVRYADGRVTGQVQAVTPDGPAQFAVDTALPPGTVDDNAVQALLPALPWAAGASWTFPMYSAGRNAVVEMTLQVVSEEAVGVPAGAFAAWRATLTGGDSEVTFWIRKDEPHTVLKVTAGGSPLSFELASTSQR